MKKTKHTIKMVDKETGNEVVYKDVVSADYHFGCQVVLNFEDGSTATFNIDEWELWDLTPYKGWNSNIN